MGVKQILPFGDPILRKTARPADLNSARTNKMLDDLTATLYDAEGRAGLAAPQVGYLRRLIVMDCGEGLIELINPEITEMSGEQIGTEACLSYPGYYGQVKRADRVTVKTFNRAGDPITLEGQGYLARCMQHEIDHLNGVLFVDHMVEPWLYHEQTQARVALIDVIRLTRG